MRPVARLDAGDPVVYSINVVAKDYKGYRLIIGDDPLQLSVYLLSCFFI